MFRKRKKSFTVSEEEPTHKVRYLGNVATSMTKGDGCVDKPTAVLWNNYLRTNNNGLDMKLIVCSTGLRVETKTQGVTDYRAHRITYCMAHPLFPKVFVWVYKHEGKKMKVELRCHAVLCKNAVKAKAIALSLHEKLSAALKEFQREKQRRQNSRLALQRSSSLPNQEGMSLPNSAGISGVPLRKKFLSTAENFKPSIERSASAPKLGAISEDREGEILEELAEEEEDDFDDEVMMIQTASGGIEFAAHVHTASTSGGDNISDHMIELTIGNDISKLKQDESVINEMEAPDSDGDSSESGFSEQESREALAASAEATDEQSISMDIKHGDNATNDEVPNGETKSSDKSTKKVANGAITVGSSDVTRT